jgi:hypothetical protein
MIPLCLAYKRVLDNDFLRPQAQENILMGVYELGRIFREEYKARRWYGLYGLLLDISIVYMALGIKQKYNSSYDTYSLLGRMGVRKWLIRLPVAAVHIIKYITLMDLFFRR